MMKILSSLATLALLSACASESSRSMEVKNTQSAQTASTYKGARRAIMVGNFDNRSNYMRGLFSDNTDQLGSQSKTILMGHLARTNRFSLMDRDNMATTAKEAKFKNKTQKIKGADFAITGDVVEFGRKDTGDRQLFGILGSGKKQIAYSKVTLNVVDTESSEVVYSVSGAGEYALSDREVLGFGGNSGYDSTLNGKVLDLAIRDAVDRLVEGLEAGQWASTK